ncbi:MAG TPA: calcium-binding protein, partial [Pirellulaceae bacterium]|nr:calcium-binding protein [Pirellulaceae bacterium]
FSAGVGVDYAVASAEVTGGVWGGLHLSKPDLSQVPPPPGLQDNDPDKIRPYSELGECLFHADGNLNAGLQGKIRLGTDLLGVDFNFDFGHAEIFSFDTDCVANPFKAPPAPKLAEFTAPGELTLNVGARGTLRNQHQNDIVENYRLTVDAPTSDEAAAGVDGDIIVVSAWGLTERFVGVKKIIGDAGLGNDKIKIIAADDPQKYPLTALVQLNGGLGDDILIYQGTGDATIHGDAGNDQLEGGGGENWLFGDDNDDRLTGGYGTAMSFLVGGEGNDTLDGDQGPTMMGAFVYQNVGYAENGNDVLNGGQSVNVLRGGAGDDKLYAGPKGDDLDGGMGNDYLEAGAGSDKLVGSRGDDTIVWNVGDGIPQLVDGGNDLETNTLALGGSENVDWLTLSKEAGTSRLDVAGLTASPFQASFMHNIVFEGLGAADQIVVNPLTNTSVRQVGLNLGDVLKYQQGVNDNAPDQITVYGADTPDSLTVETEIAIIKPAAPPKPPITLPGEPTYGGIMKVSGMPNYVVRLANVEDSLLVDSKSGGDLITVKSITGPTKIETGDGNDQVTVIASDPGTPGDPQNPADYATMLQVDGGSGTNKLVIDQSTALIAVTTDVTSSVIASELLPGVQYEAKGGTFGAGVVVKTGQFDDHVNVHDTLPSLTTSVDAGGGNDVISVSSDGAALNGDLSQIRGPLSLEGGAGSNAILLSDRAALSGNSQVVVTSSQVIGFAGATDNATVDYKATGGQLTLALVGSETVGDRIQLNSPNALIQVLGGGGADRLSVVGLTQ